VWIAQFPGVGALLQPYSFVHFKIRTISGKNGWRASVDFWPVSPEDIKDAQADAERFGESVAHFCPRPQGKEATHNDEWHH